MLALLAPHVPTPYGDRCKLRLATGFVNKKTPYEPNNHMWVCTDFRYTCKQNRYITLGSDNKLTITPQESRAARGLLNWNQTQLAQASLIGLSTVRNFEGELRETTAANLAAILRAFEAAGVIFENDGKHVGVKLKIRRGKQ